MKKLLHFKGAVFSQKGDFKLDLVKKKNFPMFIKIIEFAEFLKKKVSLLILFKFM